VIINFIDKVRHLKAKNADQIIENEVKNNCCLKPEFGDRAIGFFWKL
jgi:hypothetical protein